MLLIWSSHIKSNIVWNHFSRWQKLPLKCASLHSVSIVGVCPLVVKRPLPFDQSSSCIPLLFYFLPNIKSANDKLNFHVTYTKGNVRISIVYAPPPPSSPTPNIISRFRKLKRTCSCRHNHIMELPSMFPSFWLYLAAWVAVTANC